MGPNKPFQQFRMDGARGGYPMATAYDLLNNLDQVMIHPGQAIANAIPEFAGGNYAISKEKQMTEQANRNFINATLRRESGAVITPSELENARQQYFPQPGDSPEVIEQKRQNRAEQIAGFAREAGGYPMATPTPPSPVYRMPGNAGGQYGQPPAQAAQQAQDPLVQAIMARLSIARGGR